MTRSTVVGRRIILPVLVVSLVCMLGLPSCSEDPTAQNALVAPASLPGVSFRDTTIYATRDSTYLSRLPMDGIKDLVGGGGGYTAYAILRFTPPIDYIDTANVVSATLQLFVTYHQGPANGVISFNVYKVTRPWDPATVTWDSVQTGFYDATSPLPPVTQTIPADSQYVTITLDSTMVRKWVQTPDEADLDQYGMILVPTAGSTAVMGYNAFGIDSTAYQPRLTVLTRGPNTTTVDTTVFNTGLTTFVGDCAAPTEPASLTLQAGVVYRSWLGFDVSFLHVGDIINSAELQVDRLPNPAFNTVLTDSTVYAHLVTGTVLSSYEASGSILSPVSTSSSALSGDVRHIVQSWVGGQDYGVLLRTSYAAEFATFDRVELAGHHWQDPSLRPRIRIVYAKMSLEKKP
jgi:hypothetical protein